MQLRMRFQCRRVLQLLSLQSVESLSSLQKPFEKVVRPCLLEAQ